MRATFDRLSGELSAKYFHYLEAFTADYAAVPGAIEFRCGFALRTDHEERRFKFKAPALPGDTAGEQDLIMVMIFDALEYVIVDLITGKGTTTN